MKNIILLIALFFTANLTYAQGKLLIVGGALSSENTGVYQAFLGARPKARSSIAIIPVASSKPVHSANQFKKDLIAYGASEEDIIILPLAVKDDPNTEMNESKWRTNAFNSDVIRSIENIGAIWFTGGDQMRIVNTLYDEHLNDTPLLKKLRQLLSEQDIVIGGTSAGAAIMSSTMIAAGDSFTALTSEPSNQYYGMETQELGQLFLNKGIGFFPYGMIDQHFDRKSRLGRLIKALTLDSHHMGYGVDENTGLLIDLTQHSLTVVGPGNATIVNTQQSRVKEQSILGTQISVLSHGDVYHLMNHTLINTRGSATVGHEYADEKTLQGSGMALPNPRLAQLLGYELLDNSAIQQVRRYSFIETGAGLLFEFSQTPQSKGYWQSNGTLDQYSAINVTLNIKPIQVTVDTPTTQMK